MKRRIKKSIIVSLRNKLMSILFVTIGFISLLASEGDGTAFIFFLMIAIPMFFTKENVFPFEEYRDRKTIKCSSAERKIK